MSDKPVVQWIQDSAGVTSCHVNDGNLNFKQSLIGTLDYRKDGWHILLPDGKDIAPEGLPSLSRARQCLEQHYGKSSGERTYGALPPPDKKHEIGMTPAEIKASRMKPRQAQKGDSSCSRCAATPHDCPIHNS